MDSAYRYPEIDLLRTIAIVMMVIYHLLFDLEYYYGWPVLQSLGTGGWLLARSTAIAFLLLVGVSFVVASAKKRTTAKQWKRALHRGGMVLSCGLLITLVTYLFDPQTYIRFGILHCIGVSMMLLPLFRPLKEWNILVGIILIIIGNSIRGTIVETSLLIPLGLLPPHFQSLDYFPLIPWLGVILIGMSIGNLLYIRKKEWRDKFSILNFQFPISTWISKRALVIYMIHQPIILGILYLIMNPST